MGRFGSHIQYILDKPESFLLVAARVMEPDYASVPFVGYHAEVICVVVHVTAAKSCNEGSGLCPRELWLVTGRLGRVRIGD
jgi:hypothetical protein